MYKYAVVSEKMQFSFWIVCKQLLCIASWPLVFKFLPFLCKVTKFYKKIRNLMHTIITNKSRKFGKEILSHFREITIRRGDIFFPHPVYIDINHLPVIWL